MNENKGNEKQQWDSLWLDAKLLTMASADFSAAVIDEAALAVKNGRIAWLGSRAELAKQNYQVRETHSAQGAWITPGLIDCHTHLVYGGNRIDEFVARLNGKSYEEIAQAGGGIHSTVAATQAASPEALYLAASKRLKALLAEGVTTVEIKSGYGLDYETEATMLRVAQSLADVYPVTIKTTYLGAHTVPKNFIDAKSYVTFICDEVLPRLYQEGLVDAVDGFCERIAFSPEDLERVYCKAQSLGLPIKCHAEQLSAYGGTQLAARFGALSVDHLEYATAADIQSMADEKSVAVLLPGAFYYLQETQKPPVAELRRQQVAMAVATDCNPGSSPLCSLLTAANLSCQYFRLSPYEALRAITTHAAKALGLAHSQGCLAVGYQADFVLWDVEQIEELVVVLGRNPCLNVVKEGVLL